MFGWTFLFFFFLLLFKILFTLYREQSFFKKVFLGGQNLIFQVNKENFILCNLKYDRWHKGSFFSFVSPMFLPRKTLWSSSDMWTLSVPSFCSGFASAGSAWSHCPAVSSGSLVPPFPAAAAAAAPPPSGTGAFLHILTGQPAYRSLSLPAITPACTCTRTRAHTHTHTHTDNKVSHRIT